MYIIRTTLHISYFTCKVITYIVLRSNLENFRVIITYVVLNYMRIYIYIINVCGIKIRVIHCSCTAGIPSLPEQSILNGFAFEQSKYVNAYRTYTDILFIIKV